MVWYIAIIPLASSSPERAPFSVPEDMYQSVVFALEKLVIVFRECSDDALHAANLGIMSSWPPEEIQRIKVILVSLLTPAASDPHPALYSPDSFFAAF